MYNDLQRTQRFPNQPNYQQPNYRPPVTTTMQQPQNNILGMDPAQFGTQMAQIYNNAMAKKFDGKIGKQQIDRSGWNKFVDSSGNKLTDKDIMRLNQNGINSPTADVMQQQGYSLAQKAPTSFVDPKLGGMSGNLAQGNSIVSAQPLQNSITSIGTSGIAAPSAEAASAAFAPTSIAGAGTLSNAIGAGSSAIGAGSSAIGTALAPTAVEGLLGGSAALAGGAAEGTAIGASAAGAGAAGAGGGLAALGAAAWPVAALAAIGYLGHDKWHWW